MNAQKAITQTKTNARALPALLTDFRLYDCQKREERAGQLVQLTSRLVRISSVSGGKKGEDKENKVAKEILAFLKGIDGVEAKLVELERDDCESVLGCKRKFVFGFLKGRGRKTLALTGHFDTVGFQDEEERKRLLSPKVEGEFLHGRGAHDMKSGVAVQMLALKELASKRGQLNGSIAFIAVPDEENNSAGIMAAMKFFESFANRRGLECVGIINSDYTAPLYEGDESRYVYTGTIGKVLPAVFVRGVETHVGEAFNGFSANSLLAEITRRVEMNPAMCDEACGETTLPPTTLCQKDLKPSYNVQTPLDAVAYYNFFTLGLSPQQVLERLWRTAFEATRKVVADVSLAYDFVATKSSFPKTRPTWQPRVMTFKEMLAEMKEKNARVKQELDERIARLPKDADVRNVSIAAASELLAMRASREPAVLLLFAPPYYPAIPPLQTDSAFMQAIRQTVEGFNTRGEGPAIKTRAFYPYISDISYMVKPPNFDRDLAEVAANMPAYGDRYEVTLPSFSPPIANIGPYGHDAHKSRERTHIPYSFKLLPEVLLEVIARVFEERG